MNDFKSILATKPSNYTPTTNSSNLFSKSTSSDYKSISRVSSLINSFNNKESDRLEEEYKKYLSDNFDNMKVDYKNERTEQAKYTIISDRVYNYNNDLYTESELNLSDKYGINPLPENNYYTLNAQKLQAEKYAGKELNSVENYNFPTIENSFSSNNSYLSNKMLVDSTSLGGALNGTTYNNKYNYNIELFNKSIESNNLSDAANALETLNKDIFGMSYNDGVLAAVFGTANPENSGLYNKFQDNVTKLNTINDSISNTTDVNVLSALQSEKDKLEFENLLINYNQLFMLESNNRTSARLGDISQPMIDAAKAFGDIEIDTSSVGGFLKSSANGITQAVTVGATGVSTGWNAILQAPTIHVDDETARNYLNIGINIASQIVIPGLAATNVGISGAQALSTTSSYLTQEDSVLLDGESADLSNVAGSALYFGANFLSAQSIGKLRGVISNSSVQQAAFNQGSSIASTILKEATSEGIAEFAQTYGETLMYGEDVTEETFKQALINGVMGFAVSGGVTTAGMKLNSSFDNLDIDNTLNNNITATYRRSNSTDVLNLINNKSTQYVSSSVSDITTATKQIEGIVTDPNNNDTVVIFNNESLLNSQIFTEGSYTKTNEAFDPSKPAHKNVEMTLEETNGELLDATNNSSGSGNRLDHIVSSDYNGNINDSRKQHVYSPKELQLLADADNTILDAANFGDGNIALKNEMTSFIYDLKNSNSIEDFNKTIYSDEVANYFFDDELESLKNAMDLLKKYPRLKTHEAKMTMSGGKENIAYVITSDQNLLQSLRANKIPHLDTNNLDNATDLNNILNKVMTTNPFSMNINNYADTQKNYKLGKSEQKEFLKEYNSFIKSKFGKKANNISDQVEFSNMLNTNITRDISNMIDKDTMTTEQIRQIYSEGADLVDSFINKLNSTDYIKNTSGRLVLFDKISDNEYRINNPRNKSNNKYIQGYVKGNNYLSTTIDSPVNLTNLQVETINNLLETSGSSSRITKEANASDLLSVIKNNKDLSRNILQIVKTDGILDNSKLITAHNDFDNVDNVKHLIVANDSVSKIAIEHPSQESNISKFTTKTTPKKPKGLFSQSISKLESDNAINDIVEGSDTIKNSKILPVTTDLEIDMESIDVSLVGEYANADIAKVLSSIKLTDKKSKKIKSNTFGNLYSMLYDDKYYITKTAKVTNDLDTLNAISDLYTLNNVVYKNINNSQLDNNGKIIGKSLKNIFGKMDKTESEQFDIYMRLRLNTERIKNDSDPIFDLGIDDSNAQAELILNKYPQFELKSKELKVYTSNSLDKLVDAGIINSEIATDLKNKYQYYVPIYSSKSKDPFESMFGNTNYEKAKYGTTIKSTSNRQNNTLNIYKALEINEFNATNTILKNKLALNMAKSKNYKGNTGDIQYYENGQIKNIKTTAEIVKAFKGYDTESIDKIFEIPGLNLMPKLGNFKAKALTQYNAIFQLVNPIRDFGDAAFLFSEYKDKFAKNYVRAVYNVSRNSLLWNDFKRQNISADYTGKNKYLSLINNLEAMPKFAEWISALESGTDPRLAKYQAQQANINMARGGWLTKSLNKNGVPFINSAMQGMDKAASSFGKVLTNAKTPEGVVQLLISTAGLIGPGVINSLLLDDDENYQNLPYYMKNNYYFIPTDNDEGYIRIPKGRVQSLVDTLFRYGTGIDDENSTKDYVDSIWSSTKAAVLPLDLFDSTIISEISNLAKNEDTFGNPIYEDGTLPEDLLHYVLNNWGSVYGRTISDLIDDDPLTDFWTSSTFVFDSTKYDKNYGTMFDLVEKYRTIDNKSFEDSASKKYLEAMYYEINNISAQINDIKSSGSNDTDELRDLYQMRSILTSEAVNNYTNFQSFPTTDGNSIVHFDNISFEYNSKNNSFYKLD